MTVSVPKRIFMFRGRPSGHDNKLNYMFHFCSSKLFTQHCLYPTIHPKIIPTIVEHPITRPK